MFMNNLCQFSNLLDVIKPLVSGYSIGLKNYLQKNIDCSIRVDPWLSDFINIWSTFDVLLANWCILWVGAYTEISF